MPVCPQCHQSVTSMALKCPHCQLPLKAFGHPGIPLHRATDDEFLCGTCFYDQDDSCNYPQRPRAKECMLYHPQDQPLVPAPVNYASSWQQVLQRWVKQNLVWLVLLGLILLSVLLSF